MNDASRVLGESHVGFGSVLSVEMGDVWWLIIVVRSPKCKDLTSILRVFEFERNGYVLEWGFRVLMIFLLNLELFMLYLDRFELGVHGFVLGVDDLWFIVRVHKNPNLYSPFLGNWVWSLKRMMDSYLGDWLESIWVFRFDFYRLNRI